MLWWLLKKAWSFGNALYRLVFVLIICIGVVVIGLVYDPKALNELRNVPLVWTFIRTGKWSPQY